MELRPLTILYGRNNAGKSAMLRALAMVSDSLRQDGLDALNLGGRLSPWQWGFRTLRHYGLGDTDDPTIGIRVGIGQDSQDRDSVTWRISEPADWGRTVVERLELERSGVVTTWTHQLRKEERRSAALTYASGAGRAEVLTFRGLSPPDELGCTVDLDVLWLHASRRVARRETEWAGPVRRGLQPDGADAPTLLADDDAVRASVASWFERAAGLHLTVVEPTPRRVCTRARPVAGGFEVDLLDSGEGIGQLLPVVTALALLRHREARTGPDVVAMEEPELHLHKDLQRALLDEAVDVARLGHGSIVLETHSPTIFHATQLALATGRLTPEHVGLYWVSRGEGGASELRKISIDPGGWITGDWPPTALREDLAIQSALQDRWDELAGAAR